MDRVRSERYHARKVAVRAAEKAIVVVQRLTPKLSTRLSEIRGH